MVRDQGLAGEEVWGGMQLSFLSQHACGCGVTRVSCCLGTIEGSRCVCVFRFKESV